MNEQNDAAVAVRGSDGPKELIAIPPDSLLITHAELRLMWTIASTVQGAAGEAVPKGLTTASAMAIMLAGWEMGFRPMTSLRHIHTINGRTEPDAQAMAALVMSRDPSARFVWHEYTQEAADVELFRAGREPVRCRYTLEDAKRSGQAAKSGPWQAFTRDMLAWSAMKRCCRLGAADLVNLAGVSVAAVPEVAPLPLDGDDDPDDVEIAQALAYNEGDEPDEQPTDGQRALGV